MWQLKNKLNALEMDLGETELAKFHVCEWSKGGACKSPKDEGGRQLPITAGLPRFFALGLGKARVAIEWYEIICLMEWSNYWLLLGWSI